MNVIAKIKIVIIYPMILDFGLELGNRSLTAYTH